MAEEYTGGTEIASGPFMVEMIVREVTISQKFVAHNHVQVMCPSSKSCSYRSSYMYLVNPCSNSVWIS